MGGVNSGGRTDMDLSPGSGSQPHALVVGGTGMLRGLPLHLVRRGYTVSVIARNTQRLHSLAAAAAGSAGEIIPLSLDYGQDEALRAALAGTIEEHGPITLAVCWIHSTAPAALQHVAEAISARSTSCRFFHVRGSAVANPASRAHPPEWLSRYPQLHYRQVILGFVVENGGSRWLTHREISHGVMAAVDHDAVYHVVGTVEPWS